MLEPWSRRELAGSMDIKQNQMPTSEERVVLRNLALSVAGNGCKILEIGSWCGDSAKIFGQVAREKDGQLFCVDWWRGNLGTGLMEIAEKVDVFSIFWDRMRSESLEESVVPIRGRSDLVVKVLKNHTFDLVFIDGDHRYESVLADIRAYAPLVRKGGILCGHDCEGRISDYDQAFLGTGKAVDYYETVHCGVVLAVGASFEDYSINHAIWSVRAIDDSGSWEATNVVFPEIVEKRQPPPPFLACTDSYLIQRYGRLVYAIPRSVQWVDITSEQLRNDSRVIRAESLAQLAEQLDEPLRLPGVSTLLESFNGYDLIGHDDRVFALTQSLEPLDPATIDHAKLKKLKKAGKCFVGSSVHEVKQLVHQSKRRWPFHRFR
jgi:predicted O-methyltransferase YrrM